MGKGKNHFKKKLEEERGKLLGQPQAEGKTTPRPHRPVYKEGDPLPCELCNEEVDQTDDRYRVSCTRVGGRRRTSNDPTEARPYSLGSGLARALSTELPDPTLAPFPRPLPAYPARDPPTAAGRRAAPRSPCSADACARRRPASPTHNDNSPKTTKLTLLTPQKH